MDLSQVPTVTYIIHTLLSQFGQSLAHFHLSSESTADKGSWLPAKPRRTAAGEEDAARQRSAAWVNSRTPTPPTPPPPAPAPTRGFWGRLYYNSEQAVCLGCPCSDTPTSEWRSAGEKHSLSATLGMLSIRDTPAASGRALKATRLRQQPVHSGLA